MLVQGKSADAPENIKKWAMKRRAEADENKSLRAT